MQHPLPIGFYVRRPTMDDVPAVVALAQARETAEYGSVRTTEQNLRNRWEMSRQNLDQDYWLFMAPDGHLAAMCTVGHWEPTRLISNLSIHPMYTQLDLYPHAIELVLARARELVSAAPTGTRVTLNFICTEKHVIARQALEYAGFAYIRSEWLMRIGLHQPPPTPVWPDGIMLRPYTPDLLRAVFEADDEAFQDHWGHVSGNFEAWQEWTVKRPHFDPTLWFIAHNGEEITGLALCVKLGEEAYVDNLAVRRPWRRKGLGLALLYHTFGEFYRRGERTVALNVDSQNLTGATRLYTRAGMHVAGQTNMFQLELRAGRELALE